MSKSSAIDSESMQKAHKSSAYKDNLNSLSCMVIPFILLDVRMQIARVSKTGTEDLPVLHHVW